MPDKSKITRPEDLGFPAAKDVLSSSVEDPGMPRRFISVFDQWLGKEKAELLDCKNDGERLERNQRLLAHWARLFDGTPVFRLLNGEIVRETDRDSFLDYCRFRPAKKATEFAFVLLPELGSYYKEDWDDTNIVWYSDEAAVQPLFQSAVECGLHVINDWRTAC